jgi:hypothetical protein
MIHPLKEVPESDKPKLLDQVRQLLRLRHYSLRTEEAYVGWIRRYILFHGKRHPRELDEGAISAFLSSLAVDGRVAASTQNQHVKASLTCRSKYKSGECSMSTCSAPRATPDYT